MDLNLQLLQSTFNTTLVAIAALQAVRNTAGDVVDFEILFVNDELQRQTNREDLAGKYYAEEYPGIKETGVFNAMVRVLKTGKPRQLEYHYQHEGFDNWFQSMFVKIEDGIVATNLDITHRKLAELKAKTMRVKRSKELYQAAISAQETERRRIAESIHNGLGQVLFGVKLALEGIKFDGKLDIDKLAKTKASAQNLLNDAIKEVRRVSHELSPVILEDFGLKAAIEDICEQFRSVVYIRLNYQGPGQLNSPLELTMYRIVQELLHNMAKHSRARQCVVDVNVTDAIVTLRVEDDGVGFPENPPGGLGLFTLKNQIRLLEGKLTIDSKPGMGTKVSLSVPYR